MSAAVALISIPLTIGYLGVDRYATWVLISSFIGWLAIADLGLGSALVNGVAVAFGHDDRDYGRQLIATAFWTMTLAACLVGLVLVLCEQVFGWDHFFGSPNVPGAELRAALNTAVLCFCLGFPLMMIDALYRGLQEGYKMHLWNFIGALCSLVALLAVTSARGGLPLLVIALLGVRSLVRLVNFGVVFLFEHPTLRPYPKYISMGALRNLLRLGGFYFVQQVAGVGMFQLQPLIIANLVGITAVAEFNVAYRLYGVPTLILFFVLSPFIAAYSEASALRDMAWMREAAQRTVIASVLITSVVAAALAVAAPAVIHNWVGRGIASDRATIYWLSLYIVALAIASPLAAFVQGLQAARQLAGASLLTGVVTVVGGALLVTRFGPAGMAAGMTLALCVVNIPLLYRAGTRALTSLEHAGG